MLTYCSDHEEGFCDSSDDYKWPVPTNETTSEKTSIFIQLL